MTEVGAEICLKSRLENSFKIIKEYSWLLDSYVLDFYTENHVERLQISWKDFIQHFPLDDFEFLLNPSLKIAKNVWPLSILSLKTLIQNLSLPRSNDSIHLKSTFPSFNNNVLHNTQYSFKSSFSQHPKLQSLFLKHVKPKKRYEIFKMAETTFEIANRLGVQYIVDVGSGLGHLSRIISYGFNLNVCSIETQSQLTKQAEKLDCELEKTASKFLNSNEINCMKNKRPVHINQTIKYDLSTDEFLKSIVSAFSTEEKNFRFGIVGLHPCGDLASVLLNFYINCTNATFINLVGCCYHKLSTTQNNENDIGFPLTKFCAQQHVNISYEARALACHAIESYCERLKSNNYDDLKIHCYRATLEKLIDKNWPQYKKSALGNVKSGPTLSFNEYCKIALKKHNLTVPKEDLESVEILQNLLRWEEVVKFYSLRLMLAPLVETVILLDRQLYLLEKGIQCQITTAFDPDVSPRNQLLISEKIK